MWEPSRGPTQVASRQQEQHEKWRFACPSRPTRVPGSDPSGGKAGPKRLTRRERPKSRGGDRWVARAEHWRCLWLPKGARPSSKVTSRGERFMKSQTICSAVWLGSGEKMADGQAACPMEQEAAPNGSAKQCLPSGSTVRERGRAPGLAPLAQSRPA